MGNYGIIASARYVWVIGSDWQSDSGNYAYK